MWEELGISGGTAIIILVALYFIIKWAVKNGTIEAYEKITGNKVKDDIDEFFQKEAAEKENKKTQ
ncbi:DUF6019 family protein [Candidatus Merdisoma sp. JLR.KK006]|uniref:DUF6019 family protein n=1 Tax=Candidatus Merdisoma sp. JLR.KK006 TaxID=3112626 RepID=UPI002FF050DB